MFVTPGPTKTSSFCSRKGANHNVLTPLYRNFSRVHPKTCTKTSPLWQDKPRVDPVVLSKDRQRINACTNYEKDSAVLLHSGRSAPLFYKHGNGFRPASPCRVILPRLSRCRPSSPRGRTYPLADDIPLDKDNDLVQLNDNTTLAAGIVTYISGRILDANGNPVKNALVELWHADREGDYVYYTGVGRNPACDANFAGFGQFLTGSSGAFRFRTIKAGLYNGRTFGMTPRKTSK